MYSTIYSTTCSPWHQRLYVRQQQVRQHRRLHIRDTMCDNMCNNMSNTIDNMFDNYIHVCISLSLSLSLSLFLPSHTVTPFSRFSDYWWHHLLYQSESRRNRTARTTQPSVQLSDNHSTTRSAKTSMTLFAKMSATSSLKPCKDLVKTLRTTHVLHADFKVRVRLNCFTTRSYYFALALLHVGSLQNRAFEQDAAIP